MDFERMYSSTQISFEILELIEIHKNHYFNLSSHFSKKKVFNFYVNLLQIHLKYTNGEKNEFVFV